MIVLAHELQHAQDWVQGYDMQGELPDPEKWTQWNAIRTQNIIAKAIIGLSLRCYEIPGVPQEEEWMHYMCPYGFDIDQPAPQGPRRH